MDELIGSGRSTNCIRRISDKITNFKLKILFRSKSKI